MACGSCGTTENGVPRGCKSNGNCGSGTCGSGSEKLAVFDWLSNMTLPSGEAPFNIFEVRFKNGRKHFFKNPENLTISMGDVVAVEGSPGHDVGVVSLAGELVKVQMKKRKVFFDDENVKKIYRKATQKDIDIWQKARDRELETQTRGREILGRLGLKMKLSDVEFQGDGNKATFYYTAEARVDFRQLIKDLASAFSIRIEMKQVGARQEAARLGGIGSCGRELCCSTWLTDFRKVTTTAARYQQLSLNPLKLAGQCGKLKCCLNFELDTYLDALDAFPKQDTVLKTEKGSAVFIKMDIFKKLLWYTYKEDRAKWYRLTLNQVQEIIELNKNNELAIPLEEYESEIEEEVKVDFENVVGQDSLTRFDAPKHSRRKRNNRRNNRRKKAPVAAGPNQPKAKNNQQGQKKEQNKKKGPNQPKQQGQKRTQNKEQGQKRKPQNNNRRRNSKPNENRNEKNRTLVFIFAIVLLFASCDSNGVFDQYLSMDNNTWSQEKPVEFEFQIQDTISRNNLYINIRNNEAYGYSNLFLITHLNFPNGKKVVDTLEYEMADKNGKFLGHGLSETKENKLFYKEGSVFPVSGNYKLSIQQAMRKNGAVEGIKELEGILNVGLRIEKMN